VQPRNAFELAFERSVSGDGRAVFSQRVGRGERDWVASRMPAGRG
jgi:hypothetical protein